MGKIVWCVGPLLPKHAMHKSHDKDNDDDDDDDEEYNKKFLLPIK